MKLFHYSKGLQNLVDCVIDFAPVEFFAAIRKATTRKSRKVAYPCDLLTFNIVLECVHDATGLTISVNVEGKDIPKAFQRLSNMVKDCDQFVYDCERAEEERIMQD